MFVALIEAVEVMPVVVVVVAVVAAAVVVVVAAAVAEPIGQMKGIACLKISFLYFF